MAEIDYKKGLDDPIAQRMKYGKESDLRRIEAVDESLMDRAGRAVQDTAEAFGMSRSSARKAGAAASLAGEMAPIAGDVNDANEVRRALDKNAYGEAALAGLGFVPFIGGALRKGAEISIDLFKGADKVIQKDALRLTAESLGRVPNLDDKEDVTILVLNARDIERKLVLQRSAEERPDIPQGGNTPVSFGRNKRDVYHGVKGEKREFVEESGVIPSEHAELKTQTVSTSSDPIYSARHFAEDDVEGLYEGRIPEDTDIVNLAPNDYMMQHEGSINIQEYTGEEFATLKPEVADVYGMDADTPITLDEMEMWGIPEEDLDFKEGGDFAARIPKVSAFNSEAETIVGSPDTLNFIKISENPEKAEFIKKGIKEANEVFAEQTAITEALNEISPNDMTPLKAKKLYNRLRDNLKAGASLSKYTEDNSARGTYDWYIGNWTRKGLYNDLTFLADALPGSQLKRNIMDFRDTIEKADELRKAGDGYRTADAPLQREVSKVLKDDPRSRKEEIDYLTEQYEMGMMWKDDYDKAIKEVKGKAKEGVMAITDRFAEGGLVQDKRKKALAMKKRKQKVQKLNALVSSGAIDSDVYDTRMKSLTAQYKPYL